jgi:hypothetical protein
MLYSIELQGLILSGKMQCSRSAKGLQIYYKIGNEKTYS